MDLNTINEQDYCGAISSLEKYEDLSYIDNGPALLISICRAYIDSSKDSHAQKRLNDLLANRNFIFQSKACPEYNRWTDVFDEISLPTFA